MLMELATPTQIIPPLVPPRMAPEETLSTASQSAGRPRSTVVTGLNFMQADPSTRRQIGLAAKAALDEGFRSFGIGDMRGAEIGFRRLIDILPSSMSYALLAYTYYYREDYQRAATYFDKATKLDPADAHAQASLGLTYSRLGKPSKAITAFRQALRVNPSDAGIYFYLGHLYATVSQWHEAIKAYGEAIRLNKDMLAAYQYLADLYLDLGRLRPAERDQRFQEAINVYRDLIQKSEGESVAANQNIAAAYIDIGVIYRELTKNEEALEAFKMSITYDPNNVIGLANISWVHLENGGFAEARPVLKKLADLLEKDEAENKVLLPFIYYNLGVATLHICSPCVMQAEMEEPELPREAEDAFKKAIELEPQNSEPYIGLGVSYFYQGLHQKAKETFLRTLEINPRSPEVRNNLRLMLLDEILQTVKSLVEAANTGKPVDIDDLVNKVAAISGKALKLQETPNVLSLFTSDDLVEALVPEVKEMNEELRFKFAAKLFERKIVSSETAGLLAGVDRVEFLLGLEGVGVAVISYQDQKVENETAHSIPEREAERAATLFLRNHLPDRFMATDPRLDPSAHLWRVSVVLSYPGLGSIGEVGEVLIRGGDEQVIYHTPFEEMRSQAKRLYALHRDAIEAPVL